MSRLADVLADAVALLRGSDRAFALVGWLAVSARALPRFTQDVGLAVAVSDDSEAEAVVRVFRSQGYSPIAVVEQEATGRLATVRLIPPGEGAEGIVLDLIFATTGIEREIAAHADMIEVFSGVLVPVARVGYLVAMKLLSETDDRPQDRIDLRLLAERMTDGERGLAEQGVAWIRDRGFNRNRDIEAALLDLLGP